MPLLLRHKRFRLSGGETCWGERGESLFKWFRALSLTTPFCTHSATEAAEAGGRGDIKGFRNPKKAFKVLLYKADTKAAAAAAATRRIAVDVRPYPSTQSVPLLFFRIACGKLFQIFMKNNQPPPAVTPLHSATVVVDDLISLKYSPAARDEGQKFAVGSRGSLKGRKTAKKLSLEKEAEPSLPRDNKLESASFGVPFVLVVRPLTKCPCIFPPLCLTLSLSLSLMT